MKVSRGLQKIWRIFRPFDMLGTTPNRGEREIQYDILSRQIRFIKKGEGRGLQRDFFEGEKPHEQRKRWGGWT